MINYKSCRPDKLTGLRDLKRKRVNAKYVGKRLTSRKQALLLYKTWPRLSYQNSSLSLFSLLFLLLFQFLCLFFNFACPLVSGVSYRDTLNDFCSEKKKNNPEVKYVTFFFLISSTSCCPYHSLTSHNVLFLLETGISLLQTLALINGILLQGCYHLLLKWICRLESVAGGGTGQLAMCGSFCRPRRFEWMHFLNTPAF